MPEGTSAKIGEDELFLIEADEYDTAYFEKTSKFLHYEIDHLIITSLEFDHADIFKDEQDMLGSFYDLLSKGFKSSVANTGYSMVSELAKKYPFNHFYAEENVILSKQNEISETACGTKFKLSFQNEIFSFETNLIGRHNILNLSSMIIMALEMGYSKDEINCAIGNLKMVKRRQEHKGRINGAVVIDDFAHHPTAIEKTLDAISNHNKDKEIIAVFEPASSTARSNLFQNNIR